MNKRQAYPICVDSIGLRHAGAPCSFAAPTPELFAALGQEPPQQLASEGGGRGVSGVAGTAGQAAGARAGAGGGERPQFGQLTPEQRAEFRARRAAAGDPAAGAPRAGIAGGGFGRVWVLRDAKLQVVRVRTGVTDGAMTAVVGGELKEGDRVVTGITEPGASGTTQTAANPLLPFGRRGGGAGGNRGAGAGAAGGARGGAGR